MEDLIRITPMFRAGNLDILHVLKSIHTTYYKKEYKCSMSKIAGSVCFFAPGEPLWGYSIPAECNSDCTVSLSYKSLVNLITLLGVIDSQYVSLGFNGDKVRLVLSV